MKCRSCGGGAVIEIRRHNAAFCKCCFVRHFRDQVEKAIRGHESPSLPARDRLVKKVNPLHRLSELETAAYAFLRGIDYIVEECPLVAGNTQLRYKEAMNVIESTSPGTKATFFLGFLERGADLFAGADARTIGPCANCGQPTTGTYCAFCRARAQILGQRLAPIPVDEEIAVDLSEEVLPVEIYGLAGS